MVAAFFHVDRQVDVTKLIGALGNFANAPNYWSAGSVGRRNTLSPNAQSFLRLALLCLLNMKLTVDLFRTSQLQCSNLYNVLDDTMQITTCVVIQ